MFVKLNYFILIDLKLSLALGQWSLNWCPREILTLTLVILKMSEKRSLVFVKLKSLNELIYSVLWGLKVKIKAVTAAS